MSKKSKAKTVTADQMNRIRAIITDQMDLPHGKYIDSATTLKGGLKLNDLDLSEIVADLEEDFDIEIPGGGPKKWETVADIENYIAQNADSSPFRVAQPKKVVVKMDKSKDTAPVRFENSRPHNLSLIMGDVEKKMRPTKATEGFDLTITNDTLYCMHGSVELGRVVVEVSEGFNGFRLYVGRMLVIDHNVGSDSHILQLCNLARQAGAAMPKSIDDWLVAVIVRYVTCVKKSLRYMLHLLNGKLTTQQLFSLQGAFELEISNRVFDFYEGEYIVTHKQADLLRVFTEMLESNKRRQRSCYMTGSSFREGDGEDETDEEREEEEREEEEEEEEEESEFDTLLADEHDVVTDMLNKMSTPGLILLFNQIVRGGHDFSSSHVYLVDGLDRRHALIETLGDGFDMHELEDFVNASMELGDKDRAIWMGE